jgi:RHS repeat-associated protein
MGTPPFERGEKRRSLNGRRLRRRAALCALLFSACWAMFLPSGGGCGGSAAAPVSIEPSLQGSDVYSLGDHLGNVHILTDAAGSILKEIEYYPYGIGETSENASTNAIAVDYAYTGKEIDDETELIYFGGRYYSRMTGRWITPDPLHLSPETPPTPADAVWDTNLYAYARGNPLRYIDPDGFRPGDVFTTSEAAARDALQYINPRSIYEGREFGGWIRQVKSSAFTYDEPTRGTKDSLPNMPEMGTTDVAWFHTHGDPDPRYDNEHFSPQDKQFGEYYDANGYLGTPAGVIKKYNVDTGTVSIIGRTATKLTTGSPSTPERIFPNAR